jgi:glutamate synthase (NADPH/NADH) large chain
VVVLGPTGRNFAAGMSGGIAYVYDPNQTFASLVNYEMVELESLDDDDRGDLLDMITRHLELTGSAVAERVIDGWANESGRFRKVMPRDYKRIMNVIKAAQAEGLDTEATNARIMASV